MRQSLFKTLDNDKTLYYAWFGAMHTRIDLVFCNTTEEYSNYLADRIEAELLRLEGMVNRFDEESELSLLNKHAYQSPFPLSHELMEMIAQCRHWHDLTKGYFDITHLSGRHNINTIKYLELDRDNLTLLYKKPDMALDLNGYVKGYALDRAVSLLKKGGLSDALINFGNSSVAAMGNHPFGQGWNPGVESLAEPGVEAFRTPALYNQFLTTSGNHHPERFHIRNPQTGEFICGVSTLSVITESGAVGEILSTALYASPPEVRVFLSQLPECLGVFEQ